MQFDSAKCTALARVGKPVGLAGQCRIFPFGDTIVSSDLPLTLWVGTNRSAEPITLVDINAAGEVVKAKFEGFKDCDAVDRIKNLFLYMETERLPETDEDEYYFRDLEGLSVETETGEIWGTVTEVFNFPTTDAIEVKRKKNGERILVPFRRETVSAVLIAEKKIVVSSEILEDLL